MSTLAEFLFAAPARRSTAAIITWWERRRLFFNACVGGGGLLSLGAVGLLGTLTGEAGMIPVLLVGSAVFGLMANICYCLGPVTELLVERVWGRRVLPVGPLLYRMGLTFSVGLALFPALLAVLVGTARLVLAVLGLTWD